MKYCLPRYSCLSCLLVLTPNPLLPSRACYLNLTRTCWHAIRIECQMSPASPLDSYPHGSRATPSSLRTCHAIQKNIMSSTIFRTIPPHPRFEPTRFVTTNPKVAKGKNRYACKEKYGLYADSWCEYVWFRSGSLSYFPSSCTKLWDIYARDVSVEQMYC